MFFTSSTVSSDEDVTSKECLVMTIKTFGGGSPPILPFIFKAFLFMLLLVRLYINCVSSHPFLLDQTEECLRKYFLEGMHRLCLNVFKRMFKSSVWPLMTSSLGLLITLMVEILLLSWGV